MLEHVRNLRNLAVLRLNCGEKFLYARCQQLLDLLLEQGPDSVEELLGLGLLLLHFADLVALHEFEQIGKLEILLALVLEYFAPLVEDVHEDLLAMELITVEQRVDLGFPPQADVVQHGHSLLLHPLDQLFDLRVELGVVSPDFVEGLDGDDEHVGL